MRSKPLSKQDRDAILARVREAAKLQWEASPLHAELVEAMAQAGELIEAEQLRIIPQEHRDVLDLYGGHTVRRAFYMTKSDNGKVLYVWSRCPGHKTTVEYSVYSCPGMPNESLRNDENAFKFLESRAPGLLARICELDERRECETTEIVGAHRAILDGLNTTRQVYENELLRPYLPGYLLTWRPSTANGTANGTGGAPDEAIARVKAFRASLDEGV